MKHYGWRRRLFRRPHTVHKLTLERLDVTIITVSTPDGRGDMVIVRPEHLPYPQEVSFAQVNHVHHQALALDMDIWTEPGSMPEIETRLLWKQRTAHITRELAGFPTMSVEGARGYNDMTQVDENQTQPMEIIR